MPRPKKEATEKKAVWQIGGRPEVRDGIKRAAARRGLTTTGLSENILADWLEKNEKTKVPKTILTKSAKDSYILGQIAAQEKEITGKVDFNEFIYSPPGRKITALKKQLIKEYRYSKEIGELVDSLNLSSLGVIMTERNYIWFFAGFCGVDWAVFATPKV